MNPLTAVKKKRILENKQRCTFYVSTDLLDKFRGYCYENDVKMSGRLETLIETFLVDEGEL